MSDKLEDENISLPFSINVVIQNNTKKVSK